MKIRIPQFSMLGDDVWEVQLPIHFCEMPGAPLVEGGRSWMRWCRLEAGKVTTLTQFYDCLGTISWAVETDGVQAEVYLEDKVARIGCQARANTVPESRYNGALHECTAWVAGQPGAPRLAASHALGDRAASVPDLLARLLEGTSTDRELDNALRELFGVVRPITGSTPRITGSIDDALAFAVRMHPRNGPGSGSATRTTAMDILREALERMAYCGWRDDARHEPQIARYVLVTLLNDVLGDEVHDSASVEYRDDEVVPPPASAGSC